MINDCSYSATETDGKLTKAHLQALINRLTGSGGASSLRRVLRYDAAFDAPQDIGLARIEGEFKHRKLAQCQFIKEFAYGDYGWELSSGAEQSHHGGFTTTL